MDWFNQGMFLLMGTVPLCFETIQLNLHLSGLLIECSDEFLISFLAVSRRGKKLQEIIQGVLFSLGNLRPFLDTTILSHPSVQFWGILYY
jgi:hypothetical protein